MAATVFVASGTASCCLTGNHLTSKLPSDNDVLASSSLYVLTECLLGKTGVSKRSRSSTVRLASSKRKGGKDRMVDGSRKSTICEQFDGGVTRCKPGDSWTSGSKTVHHEICRRHGSECGSSGGGTAGDLEGQSGHKLLDVYKAWELLRQDVMYLDLRAKKDIWAIKTAHDKVVEVLNPLAREHKSMKTLRQELAHLQKDLNQAHAQVHLSEARVEHTLQRLADMESLITNRLLHLSYPISTGLSPATSLEGGARRKSLSDDSLDAKSDSKILIVSGLTREYSENLKNFWYPVAFSNSIKIQIPHAFESFEEKWVLFRGKDGKVGCLRDACAHRACPLSLGKVVNGCIQCPYHGWEYSTTGICEKMPSTKHINATVKSIPCINKDGLIWIWPGTRTPDAALPSASPPDGYTIHAEIAMELGVEHGLLLENLLDLAHAPFTHTTTFAKGWPVPSSVQFKTPVEAFQGFWEPYPIDMEFRPPCLVLSTIGITSPGRFQGENTSNYKTHLHQLHACVPLANGRTQLLYRLSLDFGGWLLNVPFIQHLWEHLARKVLAEDLRLVEGQQDRMRRGENVWNLPVSYDKLGVRYRRWRVAVESETVKQ